MLQQCMCLKAFPNLSKLISLKKVLFKDCASAKEVVGLTSQMHALQALSLIECSSLCEICGLSDVISLQELCVVNCRELCKLPNLGKLMKLQGLIIKGKFNQALGFSGSMPLKELSVSDVEGLPDLGLLRDLQQLNLVSFSGSMLPDFGSINALEDLDLGWLQELRELSKLHALSRLQSLSTEHAYKLQQLDLVDLVGLRHLSLSWCGIELGKIEVRDVHRLVNLQSLIFLLTPIRSLPSLKPLTQLRVLYCNMTKLEELPDLIGLTLLQHIDLSRCKELTSLGSLANLPALEDLILRCCVNLKRLPDLRTFKRLQYLNISHTGVRLSSKNIEALALLPGSCVSICDGLKLNVPEMLKEKMLEKKVSLTEVSGVSGVMAEVVMEIQAKQLEFFTN